MTTLLAGLPVGPPRAGSDVESVQYVWSGNVSALIGAVLCGLLLIAWAKYVWIPRLVAAEEEE